MSAYIDNEYEIDDEQLLGEVKQLASNYWSGV